MGHPQMFSPTSFTLQLSSLERKSKRGVLMYEKILLPSRGVFSSELGKNMNFNMMCFIFVTSLNEKYMVSISVKYN